MELKIFIAVLVVGIIGGLAGAFLFAGMQSSQKSLALDALLEKPLTEISSYQLLQKMRNNDTDFLVVDVRDRASCELGRIKGALCDPFPELQNNYASLPKDKTLIILCWSSECMLGPTASSFLASKGILVKELRIGWCEWSERGYPIDGERYILENECLVPQRSINNETIHVIESASTSCSGETGC